MKKRILSCFMALALCLTLLPATAQAAEEDTHTHCLCGAEHKSEITTHEDTEKTTFDKWLTSTAGKGYTLVVGGKGSSSATSGDSLTVTDGKYVLKDGNYYLKTDVTIAHPIKIQGNVTICLTGKWIKKVDDSTGSVGPVFEVPTGNNTLTLTNCTGDGRIKCDSSSGVYVSGGTLNLYSGQIANSKGQTGTGSKKYGGGVYVNNGFFNMYGGTITENDADYGGGVYVKNGTFNMYGGTIKNNKSYGGSGAGVYVEKNGNFIMKNTASVTGNMIGYGSTAGYGGGVYVNAGTFEMHNNASVKDNTANNSSGSSGGGVYVNSGGTFEMHNNASVTGNKATNGTLNGAGVYVTGGSGTTFIMHNNASVTGNTATNNGGGVYVSVSGKDSKFEMNDDASVTGNTTTGNQTGDNGNGGGVYMEKGTFDMNGNASVKNNETAAKSYGGGVYVGSSGTFNMNGEKTSVSENWAYNGGGVFVSNGTFAMNSTASVTKNAATQYGGVFVSDNATFTVSDRPTVTGNTITKNGAASNVHLTGSAYITIGGTLNEGASIGVTITNPDGVFATGVSTDCSGKFFSDDKTREVKYDETDKTNNKLVLKKKETQPPAHEHKWTYTANNATITAACNGAGDCNFGRNGGSVTITAPTNLTYNGEGKTATVTTNNWKGSAVSEIHYYSYVGGNRSDINGVPTNVGEYMAEITVEKQTAFVVYKITDGTTEKIPVDSITLNPTTATLKVSEYRRLNVTVKPKDATNKDVTWTSSNNEVATVDQDGTVTGHMAGTAKITATAADDSGKSATCTVTVTDGSTPSQPGGSTGGNTGGSSSGSSSSGSYDSNPIIKTETKNNADGSTTKTETRKDGTVTATTTAKDGSVSKTETKKDGSSVTENKAADGSTGTVKTGKNGQTEAKTALSNKAIENAKKNGEPVKAPVEVEASRNSNAAPTVKVELPKNAGETEVEIPVSNAKPGTVAVLVHPDGTEEILKDSIPTENGIRLTVDGSATVKIVDNSKDFIDTRNHWAREEIDFVSARELVNGMTATIYAPNASATRAQLWTILARQNDANLSGGNTWYEKAQLWSKDKGISDGTEPNAAINRAQMVTMLWRTMGQPTATDKVSFADVPAGSYYAQAVAWAVESGITAGVGGGRFDPSATCTRAQIAAFLARSMK